MYTIELSFTHYNNNNSNGIDDKDGENHNDNNDADKIKNNEEDCENDDSDDYDNRIDNEMPLCSICFVHSTLGGCFMKLASRATLT